MANEKDNAKKLPDLVPVFDMQAKTQKLVSPADIEREKGRYVRMKPAAATSSQANSKSEVAPAPIAAAVPIPTRKATVTPLSTESVASAAPVLPKDSSVEIIEERDSSKKPTAKKVETKKVSRVPQYYRGDTHLLTINKNLITMTDEIYQLYQEYKEKNKGQEIPFTSNVRTPEEQTALIDKEKSEKAGRPVTKLGYPVADISDHFMGDAIDVSTSLTKEMSNFLIKKGWYRPYASRDPVHWIKNPNFKSEESSPLPQGKASAPIVPPPAPAVPAAPAKSKVSLNTPDIISPEIMPSSSLASNDVMTGLRLTQISSLNMDQKKVNKMQPIVFVNNSTNIISSSKSETIAIPTNPDYNAYSPYAA